MGRNKKYTNDESRRKAKNEARMRYYHTNIESEKSKANARYHRNKNENLSKMQNIKTD